MLAPLLIDQPSLAGYCPITLAVEQLAHQSGIDERGAVFTRREVVQFMLDLAGYTSDKPLHRMTLLEPSFGGGEFVLEAVDRLLRSFEAAGREGDLMGCIRAVELHKSTFSTTKAKLLERLALHGFTALECRHLTSAWLISGDFLLAPISGRFDFVVGNPPYVRQELIPASLVAQYRKLYVTLYDRADLYVPFIERSLSLLADRGQLVFICANRWTKNKYGGPLRAMVSRDFHVRAYVDMVDTPAFDSDVIAYPAITLIERSRPGATSVADRPRIERAFLAPLALALRRGQVCADLGVSVVECAGKGADPWVLSSSGKRALLRRLEALYPTLEETGCKVGIGVATGADKAFIGLLDELDVESSRKIPLATTKDISTGTVQWRGYGVINPFEADGMLVDLSHYPKLHAYLERRRDVIANRYVAQKNPAAWYRTIDRITPSLVQRPKLLIPDIKGSANVVYESGTLYPHHNLYYIVSEEWDLRALQAVLLSNVARQFVASYSTTMRGGFLRFQAQYLRRIRLPIWTNVPIAMRDRLVKAAVAFDRAACDAAVMELYGLTVEEVELLTHN